MKKIKKSPEKQRLADMISTVSSAKTELGTASEALRFQLYGYETKSDVTVLRNRPFQTIVAACQKLEPNDCQQLTELLTSMPVHLYAVQWTILDEGARNPTDGFLEQCPIMRDNAPSPDCILQCIRCKCKTGLRLSVYHSRLCECSFRYITEVYYCH